MNFNIKMLLNPTKNKYFTFKEFRFGNHGEQTLYITYLIFINFRQIS